MHLVALPGRRAETEAWMKSLLTAAQLPDTGVLRYRHWTTPDEASAAFEASRLADQSPDLVVAKSLGTVIAATAFGANRFRPAAAVLIGTPFAALDDDDVQRLRALAAGTRTLFIQQEADPGGSAASLPASLNVPGDHVVAVPGDDHLYSDTQALGPVLARWFGAPR